MQQSPWKIGEHEEICSHQDGGPVVFADGPFAIVEMSEGGFFLIYGDPDGYSSGARDDDDDMSRFDTLEAASSEMVLAKAAMENA